MGDTLAVSAPPAPAPAPASKPSAPPAPASQRPAAQPKQSAPAVPAAPEAPDPFDFDESIGKFLKPEPKPDPEPKDDKKAVPAKPDDSSKPPAEGAKPKITPEFRQQYLDTKKERDALKVEVETLKKAASQPKDDPEKKALVDRAAKLESDLAEAHKKLRLDAFEKSPEYQKEYQGKIDEAWKEAQDDIAYMQVTNEDGEKRTATLEDFVRVMREPNPGMASKLAVQNFGENSSLILQHYKAIKNATQRGREAVIKSQEEYGEREKASLAEQAARREKFGQLWTKGNEALKDQYPNLFKPEDGDEEGNKLLENGFQLVDAAFDQSNGMAEDKRLQMRVWVRNAAAALPREIVRSRKLQAQIESLQEKLKKYEASDPGDGDVPGGKPANSDGIPDVEADFDYLARTGAKTVKR